MPMNGKTVIFLHIPKAAGTTMRYILRNNYPWRECLEVKNVTRSDRYFIRMDRMSRRRRLSVVMGHFGYGIHKYIHGDFQYLTMLRDPVQRVISIYFFILRKKDHRLHQAVTSRHMSLEEFIDSELSAYINNLQTRLLSAVDGRFPLKYIPDDIGAVELARAKANLAENISAAGIAEQFDESLIQFKKTFGWKDIRYLPLNVTTDKNMDIPEHAIEKIVDNNRYDLELYEFARELMRGRIQSYNGNFEHDLRAFRELNAGRRR